MCKCAKTFLQFIAIAVIVYSNGDLEELPVTYVHSVLQVFSFTLIPKLHMYNRAPVISANSVLDKKLSITRTASY